MKLHSLQIENLHDSYLIAIREDYRKSKSWEYCDFIREYLDTKHIFIVDTPKGQVVYFETGGTRQDVINKINQHKKAESDFNAWLFSIKASYDIKNNKL